VRCAQCGASLGEDHRFCGDCGTPVGGCPSCGELLTPGKRFCHACGYALHSSDPASATVPPASAATAAPGPGQQPVAERRVCSVLFCDVVGFTPLSEARDPEAVRELLSRYFEVARTVIGRYGGAVEKFIGDAVMAVWGTPTATEDDAERAVRAALDLVAEVSRLGEEAGVPGLAARAGVVTGEVAVTVGAVGEGMVAGDAVNTAARVQAAARPGQVLVDVPTQRLAGAGVGFADAGEHTLKGKAEPQELWRATRVLAGVGGALRVDGLEAPLIGRDAELRTIRELFHATAERKVPRLVLVSGPAGVGKSRLGWEFEKYADGLAEGMHWHRGRCLSYGDGVAFWALAEMVRQRLSIAEEDPADAAAGKLAGGLDPLFPDPGERAYIGARLGRLLGVAVNGNGGVALGREELFAGWRLFFERWPPGWPTTCMTRTPAKSCWRFSSPARRATFPPCWEPNATWLAPASPIATATSPPEPPSHRRSPACASTALPITWPRPCSTTRSTSPGMAMVTAPRWPSRRRVPSAIGYAASHCSTAPRPSRAQHPR
jgi:class 3 adenylate cyclase